MLIPVFEGTRMIQLWDRSSWFHSGRIWDERRPYSAWHNALPQLTPPNSVICIYNTSSIYIHSHTMSYIILCFLFICSLLYVVQQQNLTIIWRTAQVATNRTMDFIDQKAILFLDPVAFNGVKQKKRFLKKWGMVYQEINNRDIDWYCGNVIIQERELIQLWLHNSSNA